MRLFALMIPIIALQVANGDGCDPGEKKQMAEQNARAWATDLGIKIEGVSCVDFDSDNDGYVSCSVRYNEHIQAIECRMWQSGCRQPKMRVQVPQ